MTTALATEAFTEDHSSQLLYEWGATVDCSSLLYEWGATEVCPA